MQFKIKKLFYPIYYLLGLRAKFWLYVGKKIRTYENTEAAKNSALLISLKAELIGKTRRIKELEAIKKQLYIQIEMAEMDKFV